MEGAADYANADMENDEDREDRIARLTADHGVEGEALPLTGKQKEEARGTIVLLLTLWKLHCSYTREILESAPFLSRHGAQIGGIRVFPSIKINVICQVRMSYGLSVKISMREISWTHFVCMCFSMCFPVCGRQKPENPQFEPHG